MERKALKPMDGMREAFEKWAKTFPNYIDITRFENGYSDSDTNYAWVAWQAALAQPAQELAIPSTQDAASKVGPFWQEFSVVYEAIGKQQITIREIAWRCFLAAKMTTQPAQEPVAWKYDWYCDGKLITGWIAHSESEIPKSMAFNIRPLYTVPPQPAQEPVDWEQIYWDMVNAMLRDKLRTQPAREPVAWMVYTLDGASVCVTDNPADFTPEHRALPLYTIPPQRKPLTQDGTMEIANQTAGQYWMDEAHIQRFRAAVEAAHGIKE